MFQVVQSATSPVTCSTTAVRSNFKYGYHVFGQQEATFEDVEFQGDMVLIARFYLKKRTQDNLDDFMMPAVGASQEPSLYDEEACVAWAAIPLVHSTESKLVASHSRLDRFVYLCILSCPSEYVLMLS